MADGQVVFEISGDNAGIKKTLTDTTDAIESESKNWDKAVSEGAAGIEAAFNRAFDINRVKEWAIEAAKQLGKFGIDALEAASNLQEVQNVVDTTFGDQAGVIDRWAKKAGDQFGLTELQAKKFTSTLGAMFKSSDIDGDIIKMSTDLAGLSADMASFYNLDFQQAFDKIRAGISGETEPLKQLGINMSVANLEAYAMAQGITKIFDDMSQAEQTMLRYNYLMGATADAQGDFARTSDSYANSVRVLQTSIEELKATIGEGLIGPVTDAVNAITRLIDALATPPEQSALEKIDDAVTDAAETSTQAKGILSYMDDLYAKYGAAATQTDEWVAALNRLKEVMPDIKQFIDEETGALNATNAELRKYIDNVGQAAVEEAKRKAIQDLTDEYTQAGVEYYTAEVNRDLANAQAQEAWASLVKYSQRSFGAEYTGDGKSLEQLESDAYVAANALGETGAEVSALVSVYKEQTVAANSYSNQMGALQDKMASLQTQVDIANSALARLASAASNAAGAMPYSAGLTYGAYAAHYYGSRADGSHANGLDYVPFDNYLAQLHEGESILTAEEARVWRSFKNGGASVANTIDYEAMGGLMRDNIKPGGNVYLDGRIVGRVISQQQGDSLRTLERSGWQR